MRRPGPVRVPGGTRCDAGRGGRSSLRAQRPRGRGRCAHAPGLGATPRTRPVAGDRPDGQIHLVSRDFKAQEGRRARNGLPGQGRGGGRSQDGVGRDRLDAPGASPRSRYFRPQLGEQKPHPGVCDALCNRCSVSPGDFSFVLAVESVHLPQASALCSRFCFWPL